MFRAVCLDLDGTLAGFRGDFDELLDSLRTDLGLLACDFTTFRALLSEELRRDGPVTLTSALAVTLERLEQRLPVDLAEVAARATSGYAEEVILLPGAVRLLTDLQRRELPVALVTNGPSDMQRAAVRALGIEPYFDAILVSGDDALGTRKPGRAIFEAACRRLDVDPGAALMIGDDLENDIEGARAAGMSAYQVTGSPAEVGEWLATRLLRSAS